MDGCITPRGVHELSEQVKQELNLDGKNGDAVAFGKLARERYWTFEDGWRNLNHGEIEAGSAESISNAHSNV